MRLRPPEARRSWLFVAGADEKAIAAGPSSGADVLIQDLEDATPPRLRPHARSLTPGLARRWRDAGAVVAVRINPLDEGGRDDVGAAAHADAVLMAKAASPEEIRELEDLLSRAGSEAEIVPVVETAAALVRTLDLATASPRVTALLLASEDLTADIGAPRTPGSEEIAYARSRFVVECAAGRKVAIDCPFTFTALDQAGADIEFALARGYRAKSAVNADQVALINDRLTPSDEQVERARRIVAAFDEAMDAGHAEAFLDGHRLEVPTHRGAQRTLERAEMLAGYTKGVTGR